MNEKIKFKEQIKAFFWAFGQAWRMGKGLLLGWGFLSLCLSVLPAILLTQNRTVIKQITDFIQKGTGNFSDLIGPIVVLGLVMFGVSLTMRINAHFLGEVMYDSYCMGLKELMIDHIQQVPMKEFLNKEFNDEYDYVAIRSWALVNFISRFYEVVSRLAGLVSLLAVAAAIAPLIFWVAAGYAVFTIILSFVLNRPRPREWDRIRNANRSASYYAEMPLNPGIAREARLFESENHIQTRFDRAYKEVERMENGFSMRRERTAFLLGMVFYLFTGLMVIYAIGQVSRGDQGPDVFLMLYSLCFSLFTTLNGIAGRVGFMTSNLYSLTRIRRFIRMAKRFAQAQKDAQIIPGAPVFQAKNLCFSYDGVHPALSDLNFTLNEGDTVALVGENGSGKTTLTLLMLGLYPPSSGQLLFYGHPVGDYSAKTLSAYMGIFFQEIKLFHLTMIENVGFGDICQMRNEEKILEAIRKGGASKLLESMEKGLQTVLMREIDRSGRSMSGGEQQKVAISRTHMNDKPILIFDEPASMLDPLAEMEQFMNIKEKMEDNTAVLISHRVGFARLANHIFVLKEGHLVESGSHGELIALNGEYARFFNEQAEWYRTEAVNGEVR